MSKYFIQNWRPVLSTIVFLTSFVSFILTGMSGSEFPDLVLCAAYDAFSLFIMGGLDIGFPHGDSQIGIILLWICYFFAPLLTVSFVFQFVQEKIFSRYTPRVKNHTLLCGLGRNGQLIFEILKEKKSKHRVIVIEQDSKNPYSEDLSRSSSVWWIKNDFTKSLVLHKARIEKAHHVILSTNRDLENLNSMVTIAEIIKSSKNPRVFCHLGDLNLHENLKQTFLKEKKFDNVKMFNGYHCATRRLYENYVKKHNLIDPAGTRFIILGYGKFGRMLFSHLKADPQRCKQDEIIIVTLDTSNDLNAYDYSWGKSFDTLCEIRRYDRHDMHSPATWHKLAQGEEKKTLMFVCRDNDLANIELAISIKLNGPQALQKSIFICRVFRPTTRYLENILERRLTPNQSEDVLLFPMRKELKEAFREELHFFSA